MPRQPNRFSGAHYKDPVYRRREDSVLGRDRRPRRHGLLAHQDREGALVIEESIAIAATKERVFGLLSDIGRWGLWCSVATDVRAERPGLLVEGKRFSFCIRPFAFPLIICPKITELVGQRRIVWRGSRFGVHAIHEFDFKDAPGGGMILVSRETFSGFVVKALRPLFPRRRLRALSSIMLGELKRAAETLPK